MHLKLRRPIRCSHNYVEDEDLLLKKGPALHSPRYSLKNTF